MESLLPVSLNEFKFDQNGSVPCCPGQNLVNRCKSNDSRDSKDIIVHSNFKEDEPTPSSVDSPPPSDGDHTDSSDYAVLKYINEILMEEDVEGQTCMLQDCLALQAAEKSFLDVLNRPSSSTDQNPYFLDLNYDDPDDNFTRNIDASSRICNTTATSLDESDSYALQASSFTESPVSSNFVPGFSVVPKDLGLNRNLDTKYRHRDDDDTLEDGRRNKQPAIGPYHSLPDMEQPEMFDEVLLCRGDHKIQEKSLSSSLNQRKGGRTRAKRNSDKIESVDLWALLAQCAQAVASFDQRTASDLLKQIQLNSSQFGDGTQRMTFYFAEALQARLAGTPTPAYPALLSIKTSLVDALKAYKVFVQACPFRKISDYLANRTIVKLAAQSNRLHIIDFGILYGFQWPCLIQTLSKRPGGAPMLKITGIELPQPGFRPTERVEETGRRLERYCEKFRVPFEYNCIAKKWETITLDELKIDRDETTVVNCLYRLRHIPDDTLSMNSPRDTVLNLIRDMNPDLFLHGVVNGAYNSPFFPARFKEAVFHYSALFDMYEATVPREDEERMLFEREVFAREAMNVVACEGTERVERPETYKQWQMRNLRAGFRQMELDEEIVRNAREMVRSSYHRDFVIDVNGQWMLQGWKGRVINALSCWKPMEK